MSSQAERERLLRSCSSDRARLASCTHQLEELQRLVADKSRAVDSLQRQLDGQRSKPSTRGGGGGKEVVVLSCMDYLPVHYPIKYGTHVMQGIVRKHLPALAQHPPGKHRSFCIGTAHQRHWIEGTMRLCIQQLRSHSCTHSCILRH